MSQRRQTGGRRTCALLRLENGEPGASSPVCAGQAWAVPGLPASRRKIITWGRLDELRKDRGSPPRGSSSGGPAHWPSKNAFYRKCQRTEGHSEQSHEPCGSSSPGLLPSLSAPGRTRGDGAESRVSCGRTCWPPAPSSAPGTWDGGRLVSTGVGFSVDKLI